MKLKYLLLGAILLPVAMSCGDGLKEDGITVKDPNEDSEKDTPLEFTIPDYEDDYSKIAGWDKRNEWNLANVHDPSVEYWDGWYYMYCTDASYGNEHLKATTGRHFPGKRSRDLINWKYIPGPMNEAPDWVADSVNSIRSRMNLGAIAKKDMQFGFWAPVVRKVTVNGQDRLRMYYSIVVDNYIKSGKPASAAFDGSWTERAFIGMCESTDPASAKWEDKGFVTCSSTDRGRDGWTRKSANDWSGYFFYNAIDPTYIVAHDGKHWLIHGSWHSGFALLEVDPATGKPVNKLGEPWADNVADLTARYGKHIGTRKRNDRWQGSEGAEIIYKDGYYYLFLAYDGLSVPYNTRVVRSANIEGPYTDITGKDFSSGAGDTYPIVTHPYKFKDGYGWVGISHCCVFKENGSDRWFYISQGRLPEKVGGNMFSNAIMMGHVRQIVWCPASKDAPNDLWPIALPERYGGVPASAGKITKSSLIGKWELINLEYRYSQQDVPFDNYLELKSNGTLTGAKTGTWTYDENKKWLTLSTDKEELIVCVEREVDWEASPRKATIVFAGTAANLNATWWGKKID